MAEHEATPCPHVSSIDLAVLSATVPRLLSARAASIRANPPSEQIPPVLWLCLTCATLTPSGVSAFDPPPRCSALPASPNDCSTVALAHPLTLEIESGLCWCHACNADVHVAPGINELVDTCAGVVCHAIEDAGGMDDVLGFPSQSSSDNTGSSDFEPPEPISDAATGFPYRITAPGLINLGHTCFFNSAMQNLSHCRPLLLRLHTLDPHLPLPPHFSTALPTQPTPTPTHVHPGPLTTPLSTILLSVFSRASGSLAPSPHGPPWTPKQGYLPNTPIDPTPLFAVVRQKWEMYRAMREQDSHEVVRRILDGVGEEQDAAVRGDEQGQGSADSTGTKYRKNVVEEVFGGTIVSLLVCDACKSARATREPTLDLLVPIPTPSTSPDPTTTTTPSPPPTPTPDPRFPLTSNPTHLDRLAKFFQFQRSTAQPPGGSAGVVTLEACIANLFAPERLDGNDSVACDTCSAAAAAASSPSTAPTRHPAQKRLLLLTPLPPVLVIGVKRFAAVGYTGRVRKVRKAVAFGEHLDLGDVIVGEREVGEIVGSGGAEGGPFATGKAGGEVEMKEGTKYRLRSVVVHGGSAVWTGHFYAYVRVNVAGGAREDVWVYASDTKVRYAEWDEVSRAQAYLFFYERVDEV
ncbi:cysteine proteinase [Gonapodya prolifera JEL478]|uniref:ubiquitinyl hydrolase 1 n=1 Tax=Gonapodya prolifera (strain JEL478) TaxID=1344416 RepID=A0A139AJE5_GONPJ|nr:cysteine proteinase [Gonapodya prolifera JEL478]|eukprot:KXS16593.1 cysteine proteinase [Gonapodya prolifera JEL478]